MTDKPWETEPDHVMFMSDAGYVCEIKRHDRFGHLNGYIYIPKGHPDYGKTYMGVVRSAFLVGADGGADPELELGPSAGLRRQRGAPPLGREGVVRDEPGVRDPRRRAARGPDGAGGLALRLKALSDGRARSRPPCHAGLAPVKTLSLNPIV